MVKTPEEYFEEQTFGIESENVTERFTDAERAFMQKYLGMDDQDILQRMGKPQHPEALLPVSSSRDEAEPSSSVDAQKDYKSLEEHLQNLKEVQMVSFYLDKQEFTVPIIVVQEVIRFMTPTKLPSAPRFIAGMVNLRGRVTPLVFLGDLLGVPRQNEDAEKFIIICKCKGLQVGLIIDRVHTMYRVPQDTIEWSIESKLGILVDCVCGLMNSNERLVSIISVDRVVERVLQS